MGDLGGDFKPDDVHSPNDWEHVNLGSEERNKKFLRLMGGKPDRTHKGKIVIGEDVESVHKGTKDPSVINLELENQFRKSLEKSDPFNRHAGLGCQRRSSFISVATLLMSTS
uniref:Small acidic protein n=1 Tax=Trichobilharzia regenti TaxID=157069 RepID=A0AA85ISS6_TRIRE|nr:unnamed protein product [Trichobilharzia regenti]